MYDVCMYVCKNGSLLFLILFSVFCSLVCNIISIFKQLQVSKQVLSVFLNLLILFGSPAPGTSSSVSGKFLLSIPGYKRPRYLSEGLGQGKSGIPPTIPRAPLFTGQNET